MYITPTAVIKQINLLEGSLGLTLFERTRRGLTLTDAGKSLYQDARYIIGYPIWWGIAAWPVSSFVKGNDFTDKTVIPFCTSASSGIGRSGELLAEAAGTGNWLDGERFSSGASSENVEAWVNGLKLK